MKQASQSKLNCYDQCPELFHKRYIDGLKAEWGELAQMGIDCHKYCHFLMTGADIIGNPLIKWHGDALGNMAHRYIYGVIEAIGHNLGLESEQEYTSEIGDYHGILDICYIRKEDDEGHIHDWKFSRRIRSISELMQEWQPNLYCLLYMEKHNVSKVAWHEEYPLLKACQTVYFKKRELIEFRENRLLPQIEHIRENTDWRPRQSHKCSWCEFAHMCSLGDSNVSLMLNNMKEAEECFVEFQRLNARRKQMSDVLKSFVEQYGTIKTGSASYGYSVSEDVTIDDEVLLAEAEKREIPLNRLFKADRRKMQNTLRFNHADLLDKVTRSIWKTRIQESK